MPLIIAEKLHDHWSAWMADHPENGFGGEQELIALRNLAESNGFDDGSLVYLTKSGDRQEWFLPEPCPDCNGKGKYVGLRFEEDCQTCKGSGKKWEP